MATIARSTLPPANRPLKTTAATRREWVLDEIIPRRPVAVSRLCRPEILIGERRDLWHLYDDDCTFGALVTGIAGVGEPAISLGELRGVGALDGLGHRFHRFLGGGQDRFGD